METADIASSARPDPSVPTPLAPPPVPKKRNWLIWAVAGTVLVIALFGGACALLYTIAAPALKQGTTVASEWQERLARDYPGWKSVGFNVNSYSGSGGSETTYAFSLLPPDREFAVTVEYVSRDGQPAVSRDEVFRADGGYHDTCDGLLDLIERTYVKQGRQVVSVVSDESGEATVTWRKTTNVGFFTWSSGSYDELRYDTAADEWEVVSSGP